MPIEPKIWGTTECLLKTPALEIHRICAIEGGFCSKHTHQSKSNWFYVESGELSIEVWGEDCAAVISLKAGDSLTVQPGDMHRFSAIEDTVALEAYWAELNSEDIQRIEVGGCE